MRYAIIFAPQAEVDLLALRANQRSEILDAITRHGVPAGILIGFEHPDAWWEELLLRDPRFRERVAQARESVREGRSLSIEELREKHDIQSPADSQAE